MAEPRFLVVRLSSLGDIVHTLPAVAALRESFPTSEIVWVTHPRWSLLVERSGLVSEIWPTETRTFASLKSTVARIRKNNFNSAIDYQGLWKSAALPFLGGVKKRIGFSSASIREFGVPVLYSDRVAATAEHIADQNGELSLRAGALKAVGNFALQVTPDDEAAIREQMQSARMERYVVLSPGGGWRSKCWPAERFGALCAEIYERLNLRCVINYGPGEEGLAHVVRRSGGKAEPQMFSGELGRLMAILRGAMCIVAGDTGPLHLAVALGTPAVALFGPTNPERNGPYRAVEDNAPSSPGSRAGPSGPDIVLRAPRIVTTYKRGDQPDAAMLKIQVGEVFAAVKQRIGASV